MQTLVCQKMGPEFEAISKLLQSLGISALFGPLLGLIAVIYILKKSVFVGTGDFLRSVFTEFLGYERDRVKVETEIQIALRSIIERLDRFMAEFIEREKRYSERIGNIEHCLTDHFSEFREAMDGVERFRDHACPKMQKFEEEMKE